MTGDLFYPWAISRMDLRSQKNAAHLYKEEKVSLGLEDAHFLKFVIGETFVVTHCTLAFKSECLAISHAPSAFLRVDVLSY